GCYKPGAIWERRFRFGNRRGSMMNSAERDGRCRPGLPLPLLFAPVMLVTALLAIWPGWLRTTQAQSWVSEEGGGVRHIVVTINKSRTLRFNKPFASAVVGAPDIVDALPMSDRVLYIQGKKVGTTNVSVKRFIAHFGPSSRRRSWRALGGEQTRPQRELEPG